MYNMEKAIYDETIRICFKNCRKRKKFQRVFKRWSQEERDNFLNGLNVRISNAKEIKVYFRKKYNSLGMLIKSDEYPIRFKEGVNFTYGEREDYISSWIISRRTPLI